MKTHSEVKLVASLECPPPTAIKTAAFRISLREQLKMKRIDICLELIINRWKPPPTPVHLGIKMSLVAKKSGFQGQKQWPPKYHIKFRNTRTTIGNIPKKYHFFVFEGFPKGRPPRKNTGPFGHCSKLTTSGVPVDHLMTIIGNNATGDNFSMITKNNIIAEG